MTREQCIYILKLFFQFPKKYYKINIEWDCCNCFTFSSGKYYQDLKNIWKIKGRRFMIFCVIPTSCPQLEPFSRFNYDNNMM